MAMDRAKMVEKLNEILRWEYSGLVQYTQFSFVVQGVERELYYKFFRENGEEALEHAHQVGDKIVALGGVPTVETSRGEAGHRPAPDARVLARGREQAGEVVHRSA